jgi:hypothetical protein
METEVFPALNLGQRSEQRTLLEIDESDVLGYTDVVGWRMVAERWGEELVSELERKQDIHDRNLESLQTAKALALEMLACDQPMNWINVKQYRDTDDAEKACYQAVVHTSRHITDISDLREIESRLHVHLHRYPGQPIAETLGLKIKKTDSRDGLIVESLQPIRPFWMRASFHEDLGKVLSWRSVEEVTVTHPSFGESLTESSSGEGLCYFSTPGYARVTPEFGDGSFIGGGMQRPRETVESELRASLCDDLQRLAQSAQRGTSADLDHIALLADDDALTGFVRTMELEELYRFTESLIQTSAPAGFVSSRIDRRVARDAVKALDEVQIVVESILSEEWIHWGNPRFYQERKQKPDLCIRADTIDSSERQLWLDRHPNLKTMSGGTWVYRKPFKP